MMNKPSRLLLVVAALSILPTLSATSPAAAETSKWMLDRQRSIALRSHAADLARADKGGYVYKTPYYWVRFLEPERMQAIFDGNFSRRDLDAAFATSLTVAYVMAVSNICSGRLPPNSVAFQLTTTTVTSSRLRGETGRTTSEKTVLVNPRFAKHFEQMYGKMANPFDIFLMIKELNAMKTLRSGTSGKYANPTFDTDILLSVTSCRGAILDQFENNLLRLLQHQPSLQKAGVSISGAHDASDRAIFSARFSSLGESCYYSLSFRDKSVAQYCLCADRQLNRTLSATEISTYMPDFSHVHKNPRLNALLSKCRH